MKSWSYSAGNLEVRRKWKDMEYDWCGTFKKLDFQCHNVTMCSRWTLRPTFEHLKGSFRAVFISKSQHVDDLRALQNEESPPCTLKNLKMSEAQIHKIHNSKSSWNLVENSYGSSDSNLSSSLGTIDVFALCLGTTTWLDWRTIMESTKAFFLNMSTVQSFSTFSYLFSVFCAQNQFFFWATKVPYLVWQGWPQQPRNALRSDVCKTCNTTSVKLCKTDEMTKTTKTCTKFYKRWRILWISMNTYSFLNVSRILRIPLFCPQKRPSCSALPGPARAGSVCVACRKTRTSNNVGNTSSWCFLRVLSCSSPSHSLTFQKFNESRTKLWRVLACFPSLHEVCPSAHRSCSSRWLGTNSRWRNFQREQPRCSANG